MESDRQLARAVAQVPTLAVDGRYYRFVSRRRMKAALDGSTRGGRWGPPDGFPVLYLTEDYDSCVIEAYRHATDPAGDVVKPPVSLGLLTCDVTVTNLLDLTGATARMALGLDPSILFSEPQQPSGAAYAACIRIAQVAHQLGRHGILAPAATHRGNTLALFTDLLPSDEQPVRVGPVTQWDALPADPRRLRLITRDEPGTAPG